MHVVAWSKWCLTLTNFGNLNGVAGSTVFYPLEKTAWKPPATVVRGKGCLIHRQVLECTSCRKLALLNRKTTMISNHARSSCWLLRQQLQPICSCEMSPFEMSWKPGRKRSFGLGLCFMIHCYKRSTQGGQIGYKLAHKHSLLQPWRLAEHWDQL